MVSFVFLILFVASAVYFFLSKKGYTTDEGTQVVSSGKTARTISAVLTVIFFLGATGAATIITSDARGLRFTFGAIDKKELTPGIHFSVPLVQKIEVVTLRPIEVQLDILVDADGAITKDNQTIGAKLTLFFVYNEGSLGTMWQDFGEEKILSIVLKSMTESFKAQVGRYDIFALPISQDSIRDKTKKQIRSMLAAYPVTASELKITNYDWSDEFDAQIKETMNRSQQVKQKEQELLITEQDAQKEVKRAEATKTASITLAEGRKAAAILDAEAKAAAGEGIRRYNESIKKTLDVELKVRQLDIDMARVNRWNGVYVPENHYGPIPVQTGGMQPEK